MTSLWGFLLQSLTVTLVAVLILFLQQAFSASFSPRWQYWLWSLLALRILIPVSVARQYFFLPISLWVETGKSFVERGLSSVYSAPYLPIHNAHPFPQWTAAPQSITDWLFVIYGLGVLVSVLYYLSGYIRLRLLLRRGTAVDAATADRITTVAEQYHLQTCRAIQVEGIHSPFVCGILRPVLVLPTGWLLEDKVLLHELLHVKSRDPLQSLLWVLLLSLHWCNPILRLTGRKIRNDMEALCDQRALECLEGEERRDYGRVLLSMVDERHPSRPGTSCISNGGRQIRARIACIARFKSYERSMGVLVLCISILLSAPLLLGLRNENSINPNSHDSRPWSLARLMAASRTMRCETVAGALDTYAKALMNNHGIYLASASPLSAQEAILEQMRLTAEQNDFPNDYHIQGGLDDILQSDGYAIYDLRPQNDGSYTANLVFYRPTGEKNPDEILQIQFRSDLGYYAVPYQGPGELLVLPVKVWQEDAWVVAPTAEQTVIPVSEHRPIAEYGDCIPNLGQTFVGESRYGTVRLQSYVVAQVMNNGPDKIDLSRLNGSGVYVELFNRFDSSPKLSADFARTDGRLCYDFQLSTAEGEGPQRAVSVLTLVRDADRLREEPDFFSDLYPPDGFTVYYDLETDWQPGELICAPQNNQGTTWARYALPLEPNNDIHFNWERLLAYQENVTYAGHITAGRREAPADYWAQIYWDDALKETLALQEVF